MNTDAGLRWFAPDPRCIIDLNEFHVPERLARKYRQKVFTMRVDTSWNQVLNQCANREETWINDAIKQAYTQLFNMGLAHSVEAVADNKLVGGLYGVSLGGAFMAESMFHISTDASKFCLVYLVERLKERGFTLLDVQYLTPHLSRFGARLIPAREYVVRLAVATKLHCLFN